MELPEEIVPEQILGQAFEYDSLLMMLDDIQRLRKKTGWMVASSDTDQHCVFILGVEHDLNVVFFKFEKARMRLVDWPRSYLGVDRIKYAFMRRAERLVLVKAFNQIPQEIDESLRGEARSVWERLSDDDI